jgi:hypothetical protein
MNVRPPPYNPYIYNGQQPINVATAPPLDGNEINHEVYPQQLQYPQNIENSSNYMYNQQTYNTYPTYPKYPPQIYIPPPYNYKDSVEQYNRQEMERQRRREDECCCFGILAALCCCFVNVEM